MTANIKHILLFAVMMIGIVGTADNRNDIQAAPSPPSFVTIDVFSKQLRLLKENKNASLVFRFPDNCIIENKQSGMVLSCKKIEIRFNDTFQIRCDDQTVSKPYDFIVKSEYPDAVFSATIDGEQRPRAYSMPLSVRGDYQNIHCVVTENTVRYARDCAASEYGFAGTMNSEAGEALALIILARARFYSVKPLHTNAVFCDLTHCQHYLGRQLADISEEPAWVIDAATVKKGLFFHACCGGRTFGTEVFKNTSADSADGIIDRITDDGKWLCRDASAVWERDLPYNELAAILYADTIQENSHVSCIYDKKKMVIAVHAGQMRSVFAPEDFRLRINRVKGWSFLRSNNYDISESRQGMLHFSGYGLGHGVGLCQNGATALAKRGYSRYEILQHYYKNISFEKKTGRQELSPYLLYYRFNLRTGAVGECTYSALSDRLQPTGSVFKVLVALYLVSQRPDIASSYGYFCREKSEDTFLPKHCGNVKGHGNVTLESAIAQSCNYYFCSLYKKINSNDFESFLKRISQRYAITVRMPAVTGDGEYALLLAGLDKRTAITVADYAKIVRLLYSGYGMNEYTNMQTEFITREQRQKIYSMLFDTFVNGTASEKLVPHQPFSNFDNLSDVMALRNSTTARVWGKTSTLVSGTNSQSPYGLFIGGSETKGIVTIIRYGNGNLAAQQARYILNHNNR